LVTDLRPESSTGAAIPHSPKQRQPPRPALELQTAALPPAAVPGTRIGIAAFTSALTSALSREFSPRLTALLISRLKA